MKFSKKKNNSKNISNFFFCKFLFQAHYFVGLQETSEATWLLYLDPHTTQTYNVDEFDESLHTSQMCWMKADRIDPSLAVGFLFDNVDEFESWSQVKI